jgi:hypothetical protein
MATNKTRLQFMRPTTAQYQHDQEIKNKLFEIRTGIKQKASKQKAVNKSFASKKKAKPLADTIKELQDFIGSYLSARKSV